MTKQEYKEILEEIRILKEALQKRGFELFHHAEQIRVHNLLFKKGSLEINLEIGNKKDRKELFNVELDLHRYSKISDKLMDVKMHYKREVV